MKYEHIHIDAIGYELAPVVVTSPELEGRLAPLYERLHIAPGQLEALTGIRERRWWEPGYPLSRGAVAAGRKALAEAGVAPKEIGCLIYAGVCREQFEPATACRVAAGLGLGGQTMVYDLSNACLGVLNGMLDVANRIALGQIRAGLVV
ncbi:MAG TPA: 3-oxoacyl-ACP synthase III, partial [Geobacteraceae bacterium]